MGGHTKKLNEIYKNIQEHKRPRPRALLRYKTPTNQSKTMSYTEISQLPPPPQWMLDEANAEDLKQSQAMLPTLMTIREFRKVMLPIIYEAKSATGRIMKDAINWANETDEKRATYEHENFRVHRKKRRLPFRKAIFHDYGERLWNDGAYNPSFGVSPTEAKRKASEKFQDEQLRKFVAYKSGKVPESRYYRAKEVMKYYSHYDYKVDFPGDKVQHTQHEIRGRWAMMDYWKKEHKFREICHFQIPRKLVCWIY